MRSVASNKPFRLTLGFTILPSVQYADQRAE